MAYPRIEWDMKHQPNARDDVSPVAVVNTGEETVTIFFNHSQGTVFLMCEGAYGSIVHDPS